MMFSVVCNDGDIMPSFIFQHGILRGLHQVAGEGIADLDRDSDN